GYYKKNATPDEQREAEIIIAKNRRGPTGSIEMKFIPEFCVFNGIDKSAENLNQNTLF
ncbi:unnamed protein product, partial [marine sediment metagenome]